VIETWRQLYVDHVAPVHGFLLREVGRDVAEDLTADVFVRALPN